MHTPNPRATHRKSLMRRHDSQFPSTLKRSNPSAFDLQNQSNTPIQAVIARTVYIDNRSSGHDPFWQSGLESGAHIEGIVEDDKAQSDFIRMFEYDQTAPSTESSTLTSHQALKQPQDQVQRDLPSLTATAADHESPEKNLAHQVFDDSYSSGRHQFRKPQAIRAQASRATNPPHDGPLIGKYSPDESFPDRVRSYLHILTITHAM